MENPKRRKKYILTDDTITTADGHTLHRIKRDDDSGELGGWIEEEKNLSQLGNCWVRDQAQVYGGSRVGQNAIISGNAQVTHFSEVDGQAVVSDDVFLDNAGVHNNAKVYESAQVIASILVDDVEVFGNATIYKGVRLMGNAKIYEQAKVHDRAHIGGYVKIHGRADVSDIEFEDDEDIDNDTIIEG